MKKVSKKFAIVWAAAVTVMVAAMMVRIMRPGNAMGAQEYDGTDSVQAGEVQEQGSLCVRTEFEDIKDLLRQRCIAVLENGVTVEDAAVLSDVFGDRQIKLLYDALAAELENQGQTVPEGLYAVIRDSSVPAKWRIILDSADVERIAGIMMEYIGNNKERLYDGDRLSDANVSALVREALESAMSGQEGRLIVSKEYISGSSDIIREVISNITGNGSYRIHLSDEDVRRITDELKDQIQMPPSQKQILGHEELNVLLNGWQEQLTRSFGSMIDFCNSRLDELGSDIDYMGRRVDNDMTSLKDEVDSNMNSLEGKVGEDMTSLKGKMNDDMASLEGRIGGDMSSLGEKVSEDMASLEGRIGGDMSELGEKVSEDMATLEGRIGKDVSSLGEKVSEDMASLEGRIGKDVSSLREKVSEDMATLEGRMGEDMSELGDRLSGGISSVRQGLDALSQRQDASDIRMNVIRQDNEESIAALKDSTMQLIEELSAVSDSHGAMLMQNMQAVDNLKSVCEELENDKLSRTEFDSFGASVNEIIEKARQENNSAIAKLAEKVKRQGDNISRINDMYNELDKSVTARFEAAVEEAQRKHEELQNSMDKRLDTISSEAQSQLDSQNKELNKRIDGIIAELDKSSSEADKKLAQLMKNMQENIGDTSKLVTSQKTVVGALNEVFQYASDGKRLIADAITAPSAGTGVKTEVNAAFAVMADNISRLARINYEKGLADAGSKIDPSSNNYIAGQESAKKGNAVPAQVLAGVTFTSAGGINQTGTMQDRGMLNWKPSSGEVLRVPEGYYKGGVIDSSEAYNAGVRAGLTVEKKQSFLKYTIDNVCSTPYQEDSNSITYNVDGFKKIYYRFSSNYGENENDESFGKASLTINNQRQCMFDEYDDNDNRIYGGRTYEGVFDCSGMSTITTTVWVRSGSSRWGTASFQITDVE